MSYIGKNPVFISTILKDQASPLSNPATGNYRLFFLNGALTSRDDSGTEVTYGAASPATPDTAGTVTSFSATIKSSVNTVTSADYTILDTDGYKDILMSTGGIDRTVTLPTAADNTGRVLTICKIDSGVGKVTVDGEGAETINGATTQEIAGQYNKIKIACDGTEWFILSFPFPNGTLRLDTGNGHGSTNTKIRRFTNITEQSGDAFTYEDEQISTPGDGGMKITANRDMVVSLSYSDSYSASAGAVGISLNSNNLTTNVTALPVSERLIHSVANTAQISVASVTVKVSKGDIIRAHTNGAVNAGATAQFVIQEIYPLGN